MSVPNHFDVVQQLFLKYKQELLTGVNDENRREWTKRVAQTFLALFPKEPWGAKCAGPGRPPSKDVIALDRTPLVGVELLIGAGTDSPAVTWQELDLSGQIFIPVEPFDWLGSAPPPLDLEGRVSVLEARIEAMRKALS